MLASEILLAGCAALAVAMPQGYGTNHQSSYGDNTVDASQGQYQQQQSQNSGQQHAQSWQSQQSGQQGDFASSQNLQQADHSPDYNQQNSQNWQSQQFGQQGGSGPSQHLQQADTSQFQQNGQNQNQFQQSGSDQSQFNSASGSASQNLQQADTSQFQQNGQNQNQNQNQFQQSGADQSQSSNFASGSSGSSQSGSSSQQQIPLNFDTTPSSQDHSYQQQNCDVGQLTQLGSSTKASQVVIIQNAEIELDIDQLVCQVYSDADGNQQVGNDFSKDKPCDLGEDTIQIQSVKCWIS